MKKLLAALLMIPALAFGQFDYLTFSEAFVNTAPDSDHKDFSWNFNGYSDTKLSTSFLYTFDSVSFRLAWPKDGDVFLDVTDGTVTTTNYVATIARTNLPPDGSYYAEFVGTSSGLNRILAAGRVNIQHSIYENTGQSSWTNPLAGTVIGPPVHTLSTPYSLWPFASSVVVGESDSVSSGSIASGVLTLNIRTNAASGGSGDLTAVQVSGSILTVASGTGPIPVVGLTTAAVNSAESDPIAILPDGTRAMTADLQIGTNKVQDVTGIHFVPTNSAVSSVEGNVYWDETDITLALRSDIADAIMQVGQEFWMRAKKDAGETISNGDAVYISGASGERPKVARADSVTNSHVVGLATHTWTSNDGWVTMEGLVRDLDTSSYSEGDELFVSATPGGLTNVSQFVGQGSVATVTRSHASAGHVFVAIVHSELEPAWNAVSNTVTANALLGSTALQSYTETDPVWGAASNGVAYLDSTQTFTGFNTFDDGSYQVDLLPGSKAAYFDDVSLTHWVHIVNGTYGIKAEVGDASSLIAGQYTDGVGGNTVNLGDNMNGFAVNVTAGASYFDGMVDLNTDALAGTDAVSWSVLTNQIALLSPAGGTYTGGTNIDVNGTIINLDAAAVASDALADSATQPADSVTTLDATAWRTLYSDASGNITELALGTSGQHLKSNGASSAPTWETPSAGGGSQTPWTNNVDAAGFALTALDYTSMNTNAAAVTGVAGKLVQYVLNDRLYSVYNSVTNYSVLN